MPQVKSSATANTIKAGLPLVAWSVLMVTKTAWLICAGVPVCATVDRLRPATSAEALAMQFAQNVRYEPVHSEDQQAFVDARAPLDMMETSLRLILPRTDLPRIQIIRKPLVP